LKLNRRPHSRKFHCSLEQSLHNSDTEKMAVHPHFQSSCQFGATWPQVFAANAVACPRESDCSAPIFELSEKILFLSRTHRVIVPWYDIYRPFSHASAILAILHIGIALFMGYRL
jgi:hypothetical protein